MSDFADLGQDAVEVSKFLVSRLGTLFFVRRTAGAPLAVARRFDAALPPNLVDAYASLVREAQRWIERHPEIGELARIEQPTEVGRDYIARPHHVYGSPILWYFDDEEPVDPPEPEWSRLLAAVAAVAPPVDERDALLARLVARSFTTPTGKTYFHEIEGRFINVDPALTEEDVRRWAELMDRA